MEEGGAAGALGPAAEAAAAAAAGPRARTHARTHALAGPRQRQPLAPRASLPPADPPAEYSTLPKFPGAEYALYPAAGYEWNPAGADIGGSAWPVPVVLLSPSMALDARLRADYNAEQVG
jgi:hypothetical protein